MNIIIRYFATLILLAPLSGQGQVIRGRVVNDLTREYISYVNIGVLKGSVVQSQMTRDFSCWM